MGISATTVAAVAAVAGAGAAIYSAANQKQPKVTPPPQASQTPTPQGQLAAMKGLGATGGAPGVASTFLTGSGGIDPSMLNLGKSTLLGQ